MTIAAGRRAAAPAKEAGHDLQAAMDPVLAPVSIMAAMRAAPATLAPCNSTCSTGARRARSRQASQAALAPERASCLQRGDQTRRRGLAKPKLSPSNRKVADTSRAGKQFESCETVVHRIRLRSARGPRQQRLSDMASRWAGWVYPFRLGTPYR